LHAAACSLASCTDGGWVGSCLADCSSERCTGVCPSRCRLRGSSERGETRWSGEVRPGRDLAATQPQGLHCLALIAGQFHTQPWVGVSDSGGDGGAAQQEWRTGRQGEGGSGKSDATGCCPWKGRRGRVSPWECYAACVTVGYLHRVSHTCCTQLRCQCSCSQYVCERTLACNLGSIKDGGTHVVCWLRHAHAPPVEGLKCYWHCLPVSCCAGCRAGIP
jgi:hypothetical protein